MKKQILFSLSIIVAIVAVWAGTFYALDYYGVAEFGTFWITFPIWASFLFGLIMVLATKVMYRRIEDRRRYFEEKANSYED